MQLWNLSITFVTKLSVRHFQEINRLNEKYTNWEIDTTSTTKHSNVCLNHTWILWPKWGCYYIDEAWGKVYWDHACCGR